MNDKTYGIWLVACVIGMVIAPVFFWKSLGPISIVLCCNGGTALMLLGRCAWKWNKLK